MNYSRSHHFKSRLGETVQQIESELAHLFETALLFRAKSIQRAGKMQEPRALYAKVEFMGKFLANSPTHEQLIGPFRAAIRHLMGLLDQRKASAFLQQPIHLYSVEPTHDTLQYVLCSYYVPECGDVGREPDFQDAPIFIPGPPQIRSTKE